MASRRKLGLAALLLSWGLACTQLFGDGHENTLAPTEKSPEEIRKAMLDAHSVYFSWRRHRTSWC